MEEVIELRIYTTVTGRTPFNEWLNNLDLKGRTIVRSRLNRIRLGNFGDCHAIKNGGGLWEFRIHFGPGYRIYFCKPEDKIVLLICAGDKGTQSRDIQKAKAYWHDYLMEEHS